MKVRESGVLPSSCMYFHTASETARRIYFYVRCTGRYQCDGSYEVKRQSYCSYLLLHVLRGHGYCYVAGRSYPLEAGHLIILNCYEPHHYGTHSGWEIAWVHFDGALACEYFQTIVAAKKQILMPQNPYPAMHHLDKIYRMYHNEKKVSEPLISKNILCVLTEFLICENDSGAQPAYAGIIEELLVYLSENLNQEITLEAMAQKISLSPYYFTRVFKKETGFTPHEFLIQARVNAAKFYLKTTILPPKEIAYRCGFGSVSAFCTTFKRLVATTPLAYRKD